MKKEVNGVSTANIYNFMANGLNDVRVSLTNSGVHLAQRSSIVPQQFKTTI
jgi:hypothetical protein